MIINTDIYAEIRRCKNNGVSMRKAASLLNISRNTIKRYWSGEHLPGERKAYPYVIENLEKQQIMEDIEKYFNENISLGKQIITAKTIWKALRDKYHVGESTIRRYVKELKKQNPQAFIPLSFDPGEVMQIDWTEVKVCIKGHIHKANVFCAVLPYSYDIFAMIMPNMQWPCFLEGHISAFEYFGGVSERVFYDNLRSAVLFGYGKDAVKQEKFKLFEAHYGFEAVFMNAAAGNEKGSVENLCGLIKQKAFTPIPKGETLKSIQDEVFRRCVEYRKYHKIKDRPRTILEMSKEDRDALHPLPTKRFEACETIEAIVGSDLTFRHNGIKYSLPPQYNGKTVTLHVFPYEIEAWYKGNLAFRHLRPYAKGENRYIPEHYLSLLEERPRATRNALPLKFGVLPPQLALFRDKCIEKNKMEQLANILLLGREVEAVLLLEAVEFANKSEMPTFDMVQSYLLLKNATQSNQDVDIDAHDLSEFDKLLEGRGDSCD